MEEVQKKSRQDRQSQSPHIDRFGVSKQNTPHGRRCFSLRTKLFNEQVINIVLGNHWPTNLDWRHVAMGLDKWPGARGESSSCGAITTAEGVMSSMDSSMQQAAWGRN